MRINPRVWEPIAWILVAINVGGAWFAARDNGTWHAATHAALAAGFALWALSLRRLRTRAAPGEAERVAELEARLAEFDQLPDLEARVALLEERLDFVERTLIDVRERAPLPRRE